ncbi:Regulator of drug sensitivity 2 [Hypsizygus marmoreus]|uniref:Regulator of drug sensitivity 2 n=1 Tax=Hypsizygus marmoreus TaxID=39966 RepID=A0A369J4X4_HYPMA|nr:Regulator of drug sensitivity 2 [Hypsizygus marmoreus]
MATMTSYSDSSNGQASVSSSSSSSTALGPSGGAPNDDGSKKKKVAKRRKVNHACLYCRRSHMTCDEGRPCQRCIKREIGHLCHDERRPKVNDKQPTPTPDPPRTFAPVTVYQAPPPPQQPIASAWPMSIPQGQFLYQPETLGNEFSVLSDFLETLDEGSFFTSPQSTLGPSIMSPPAFTNQPIVQQPTFAPDSTTVNHNHSHNQAPNQNQTPQDDPAPEADPAPVVLPAATKTEKFLLTAADQESGSRNERLNRVIRSKYEAGLLKPYNYVKGYARLSRWMDRNVSQDSKQQILQPLSVLRPKFRAVAQSLRDLDLVFIEEAFERLLLDYDRVFSAMGVPACLWRRTGEIYKGNREFTELIGVDGYMMRDGRLCIYELMAEESAVNYWEKYGHVAFDSSQKAVLTSCVLRYKPHLGTAPTSSPGAHAHRSSSTAASAPSSYLIKSTSTSSAAKAQDGGEGEVQGGQQQQMTEEGFINCCFSFTIRRDKWGIPTMIVGNFIRC